MFIVSSCSFRQFFIYELNSFYSTSTVIPDSDTHFHLFDEKETEHYEHHIDHRFMVLLLSLMTLK